jgi:stage V sporulation protein S
LLRPTTLNRGTTFTLLVGKFLQGCRKNSYKKPRVFPTDKKAILWYNNMGSTFHFGATLLDTLGRISWGEGCSLWLQWEAGMGILKVSAKSRSTAVAGAIAGTVRESGRAEAQAIGAGAVNQAVKAVAIARGYLALDGIEVICVPTFTEVDIEGQVRTAMKLIVEPR